MKATMFLTQDSEITITNEFEDKTEWNWKVLLEETKDFSTSSILLFMDHDTIERLAAFCECALLDYEVKKGDALAQLAEA